jgi:thiol reductant ABC exporter CydD subunit/thiol reductant ABC exporter CydC subunit
VNRSPLGKLRQLSPSTRRALAWCGSLAALNAVALVTHAWALSSMLADVMMHHAGPSDLTGRLAVLGVAVLARAVFGWAIESVGARAAAGAKEELRAKLLDRALELGPEWISARGPAELTVLATRGLDALDAYFTRYLPALVTATVVPLLIGAWILVADPMSALLIAVTVPLIPVFAVLIGRHTEQRAARAAEATARLSGHLLELLRALPVLTAFRRAEAQAEAVRRVGEEHRRRTLGTLRVAFLSAFVLELVATLSVALVAVGIGMRLVGGELDLATGLLVLVLAPECYLPLRAAGAAHHASEDGLEAVQRVAEVLDQPGCPGRTDGDAAAVQPTEVRVEQLRVARRGRYAPDNLWVCVRPGGITRLDSPSGTGKSTALGVLLGFVRPESGRVTVGGTDLSTVDPARWRRLVAWVPQRPAFTGGTVAEEVGLAVADQRGGPATRDELRTVAREAAAEHLVDRPVGQLSTGERQRVAVARALLRLRRGAWLLLADEPTAHLDPATAGRVTAALHRAAGRGAAVLLASHRTTAPEDSPASPCAVLPPVDVIAAPRRPPLRGLVNRRLFGAALLGAAALGCGVALTGTAAWLIARAAQQPPVLALTVAIVAVRTFGLAKGTLRYTERLLSHDAAFRLAGALRVRLWRTLVALGPARTAGLRRTDGLQRLVDDTDTVRDLVPRVLLPPLVAALVTAGAVAVQAAVLPAAGLALAAALLVAGVGAPASAVVAERRASAALSAGRRRLATAVLGLLDAAADLVSCGAHLPRRADIAAQDTALATEARRQAFGAGAATAVITTATGVAALAGAASAASAVASGHLNPVLAPLLGLLPLAVTEAVALLPPAAQQFGTLRTSTGRLHELLATASQQRGQGSRTEVAMAHGGVRLAGVDVRWPGEAAPALRDIHLEVPSGALVAVVGPSGAGKSTLLALLLGLLPPERGVARIPEAVAWCPQEPQLVSTTVRENLRLGNPHAGDDRLRQALRQAGLAGWTERLDILVGSAGTALSGGEAQRLALARALLRAEHAHLVLLDEPTAHLDEATSSDMLRRLRRVFAGRTVVHVTHRPDEAADADLVVNVRDGHVRIRSCPENGTYT